MGARRTFAYAVLADLIVVLVSSLGAGFVDLVRLIRCSVEDYSVGNVCRPIFLCRLNRQNAKNGVHYSIHL